MYRAEPDRNLTCERSCWLSLSVCSSARTEFGRAGRGVEASESPRGTPLLSMVSIPGGTFSTVHTKNLMRYGAKIAIGAAPDAVAATAQRVLGLSKEALSRFLSALADRGIQGEVPERALLELVARGWLTQRSDHEVLKLFLDYLEPPNEVGGRQLRDAVAALAAHSRATLKITLYEGAYKEESSRKKKPRSAGERTIFRRQRMFDWLMDGRGNSSYNLENSFIVPLQPAGGTASWWRWGVLIADARSMRRSHRGQGRARDARKPQRNADRRSV